MIPLKTKKEITIMRENGERLAQTMERLKQEVGPGIKTQKLDKLAQHLVSSFEAQCSFKGYDEFPNCLCVSVNEEVVHGVPSQRKLKKGDIVSLDLGLFKNGLHADMAITLLVGKVGPEAKKLVKVTQKALELGIKKARPGNTFRDIGRVIQEYVEEEGFNVVRQLCGHGIGRDVHEAPQIPNYGKPGQSQKIKEGMVFCLEPMATIGDWHVEKKENGFAFKTIDESLSAHFEHMIAVTQKGPEILSIDSF